MPKKLITYVLGTLMLITASFSWYNLDRAILDGAASDFFIPLTVFTLFMITVGIFFVLVVEKRFSWIFIALSFLLSFLFVSDPMHLVAVSMAILLFIAARHVIRKDVGLSVKISISKSLHRGIYPIVLGLALMISSQYFFTVIDLDVRSLAPNIESNRTASRAISFILSRIDPEFQKTEAGELTVDEFLEEVYTIILKKQAEQVKSQINISGKELTAQEEDMLNQFLEMQLDGALTADQMQQLQKEFSEVSKLESVLPEGTKNAVIAEWKERLSDEVGFRVSGDEKVNDIFVALINSRISSFVSTRDINEDQPNILAAILAVGLFLALLPFGSLISRIWIMLIWLIFMLLKKSGVVEISKEMREVEILR